MDQGSTIPLGWKPTMAAPVPVVRCTQIKRDGERCKKWSLRGYNKCIRHSGPQALMPEGNVNKYREAVMEAGRLRLLDEVDPAIDGLVSLSQPGTSEGIRLKAYTELLDRAGFRGGFEVDVTVEQVQSPIDELKKRILELKKGAEARERMMSGDYDDDIVEGEVVEDQLTLFELPEEEPDADDR